LKIHHLNCGSFCPHTPLLKEITHCHCLLIEDKEQLILVDTGIGKNRTSAFLEAQSKIAGVQHDQFLSAQEQIKTLGFKLSDVRHILITHLDYDHAGGILDFPNARIHLSKKELEASEKLSNKLRYHKELWSTCKNIISYGDFGDTWHGFSCVQNLPGLPPEILMIPLFGHSTGHSGFAIKQDNGEWLFHVGDAYFNRLELAGGLKSLQYQAFARLNCSNNSDRVHNLNKIKEVSKNKKAVVFSSHDPEDFNKFF